MSTNSEAVAVRRIYSSYDAALAQIRDRVKRYIARSWDGLGSYRDADIDRWVGSVVPVMLGAQRNVAAMTNAQLAALSSAVLGGRDRPRSLNPDQVTGAALRGVEPDEVYRRPGVTTWTALSAGKSLDEAVKEGRTRALSLAVTDLQLAKTHTAQRVIANDARIVGHRRVLTGAESCGLCVVASTQRYHRGDLQPIHPGCRCNVRPIYGSEDPGQVLDSETLEEAHDAVEERFGAADRGGREVDYRNIMIHQHGEIGPVLTVRGQHFTGPAQI